MIRSILAEWLVHCADPQAARRKLPRHIPSPTLALELVEQARLHGVLAGLLRNFPPFADDPGFVTAKDAARRHHRENLALATMLGHQADELMAAARDLPVAVVKGPVFARTLYPDPSLRSFTDIDVLAAPDAVPALGEILQALGFSLAEYGPQLAPQEWKWVHREQGVLMVEVQTDLIHAASLRGAVSLRYEVIADGPEMPAALLLIALVHGGAHHYDRLQLVVDVCQAARTLTGSDEERHFAAMVEQTQARFIAVAGLTLAGRIFNEPRCIEIARSLGPVRYAGLAGLLLDRTSVISATTNRRVLHAWRRQAFRLLIKRAARN
jgi:hypothetical protein